MVPNMNEDARMRAKAQQAREKDGEMRRRAEALRANLKRRKSQVRLRGQDHDGAAQDALHLHGTSTS